MTDHKTVGEIRDLYLLTGTASGWSHHTLESAKRVLKFLVDSEYGVGPETRCSKIKEERLLNYLIVRRRRGRRNKGMRYSTMNTEFLVLKRFFRWAHKGDHIPSPLLQTVTAPRADVQVFNPLTDDEINDSVEQIVASLEAQFGASLRN